MSKIIAMNTFKEGWYVLYTKPHHEKRVANGLAEMKTAFYLPTKETLRMRHDRRKFVNVPMFPSYVFVHLKSLRDYYDGLSVQGALQYVRFGSEIARISDKVVDDLRLIVQNVKDIEVSTDRFQQGQQLFIKDGPLTGVCCEVVKLGYKEKILVRIELLQRNLLITMPFDNFIAVSAS
jgi:transcriptional antiterminator RfaH